MKIMFLIFHGFEESNGICKKIRYQVKALEECGVDVHLCWLDDTPDGHKRRMINNEVLLDYGYGVKAKILKRTSLSCISAYAEEQGLDSVYIRSDHNTTPFLIKLVSRFKKMGMAVVMEIPTYPYDQEYKELSWNYQHTILLDKALRRHLFRYVDNVVTFSDHKIIFKRPTIRISNGIDFDAVPLKQDCSKDKTLHLIALATMHPWHGFDRAIKGILAYKQVEEQLPVKLHIVGDGVSEVVNSYKELVKQYSLEKDIIFHGPLFGEALDNLFNIAHIGIGSLARHRSGITHLRSLKNREYAARGIPFVYSEIDEDFEGMPYILKVEPNETPLNINEIINFYKSLSLTTNDIRKSIINKLSWKAQMKEVLTQISISKEEQ